MMNLKALFLNCTLKKSNAVSNTRAFIDECIKIFKELDIETEIVRLADYNIKFGTSPDESGDDQWPSILKKIYTCDIFIIATPVWRGDRSSIAKIVAERMDGVWQEANEANGQYPTYGKVAGVMVDGNEDGAKNAIAHIFFDLVEHGFTVPASALTYYVGKAGPGKSYIKAGGAKHQFTNNYMLLMVHNLMEMAKTLKENPYTTDLVELQKRAEEMSQ